jgi:hypothetical protein
MTREQLPLLTTGIWTREFWFRSLDLRPLNQPAVNIEIYVKVFTQPIEVS